MIEQFLSKRQVYERLSVGKSTLDRWRRHRDFPAPLQVAGLNRWRSSEIEQWLSANAQLRVNAGLPGPEGAGVIHANAK